MLARLALLLAVALLAGCGGDSESEVAAPSEPSRLMDIDGIDDLRSRFNADAGSPRLVLLLAPT